MDNERQSAGTYSEKFLNQRLQCTDKADHAPYGDWYAERMREGNNDPEASAATGSPSADATHKEEQVTETTAAPLQLVPRGPRVGLSRKTEQQLAENARELGMIEGNLSVSGSQARLLCFTSCFDGEGKTTAALHAAYGLAMGGTVRVLLVDANLSHPKLQRLFSARQQPGLSEVLAGQAAIEDALHPTKYKGLDLLPAGECHFDFGCNIPVSRMEAFLEVAKAAYDYVIVDGTSIFNSSDTARMAPLFDGFVLVAACEQTKWEVVQSAEDKIQSSGGEILGVALNRRKYYIPKKIYQWLAG